MAQRQLLEIAKALALDAKVLILDEPTESLTAAESASLFLQVDALRQQGASIVYISHRLPEVRRVADRITVLRDGEIRGTFDAAAINDDEVLALIVGRPVQQISPQARSPPRRRPGRPTARDRPARPAPVGCHLRHRSR